MDFSKLVRTLEDEGDVWILFRPGISFNLFYDSPLGDIGPTIADIIEDYMAFIAPDVIEKHLSSGKYRSFTKKALDLYLYGLRRATKGDEFYEVHLGPGIEPGVGYSIHVTASGFIKPGLHPAETNLVTLEFPHDILDKKGAQPFIDFLVACANRHKFHYAIAGFAFQHSVMALRSEAQGEIAKLALRYIGFDISYDDIRYELRGHVHNVGWLNFLGSALVKKLGGAAKLQLQVPSGGTFTALKHGVLIAVSDKPPIGDVNKKALDIQPLKDFAAVVKPVRIEVDYLGSDDDDFADRWLRRLD